MRVVETKNEIYKDFRYRVLTLTDGQSTRIEVWHADREEKVVIRGFGPSGNEGPITLSGGFDWLQKHDLRMEGEDPKYFEEQMKKFLKSYVEAAVDRGRVM